MGVDLSRAVTGLQQRLNAFQQRHAVVGFPLAVVKKYGDDAGARHAALITYYGFLSVFPLLLIVVAIAGLVLRDDDLKSRFVDAVVPDDLTAAVTTALDSMPPAGIPLVIGIVGLVFSGTGVVFSLATTLNDLQAVPMRLRLGFGPQYLRVLAVLLILLIGLAAFGGLTIAVGTVWTGWPSQVLGAVGALILVFVVMMAAVALLSAAPGTWRFAWPAAILGSIIVTALMFFGVQGLAIFVARAGPVYGPFAAVVGLFSLLYLASQALVLAAELAVVRRRRLWPRTLIATEPLPADEAVLAGRARMEERLPGERIQARFDATDQPSEGADT